MRRRSAIATLFAAGHWARSAETLGACFDGQHGTAVVIDVRSGKVIAVHEPELATKMLAPPGSTLKPFVVEALINGGKLRRDEKWRCQGTLRIGERSLACSHPVMAAPMEVETALAYSCNNFVAHFAERFREGELAAALVRYGFEGERRPLEVRLQALGIEGILVSAAGLARAYRGLALAADEAVVQGMEDAVEYGTAQGAKISAWKVAGKTGSAVRADGARIAWFAGFAPSRATSVAIAVMVQGRSGGADAAPIAGRILEAHRKGAL